MAKDKGIRVSPKHGVNPTLVTCFWCGEERGDIALLGRISMDGNDDAEAPRHVVIDYEPCDTCKERMSKGITVIECDDETEEPTGSWVVVSEAFVEKLPEEAREQVLRTRRVRMASTPFRKGLA